MNILGTRLITLGRKDSIHVFDAYLALYWNEMVQKKFTESKLYLDTLSTFFNKLPGKDYFILNAQSIYYDVMGQPERALEQEKAKLRLYETQAENVELSRVYNNIANRFIGLEQLDSAMFYAQRAIEFMEDTTYRQSYLFYQSIADIAELQGDFALSNKNLRIAYEMHNQSITNRLTCKSRGWRRGTTSPRLKTRYLEPGNKTSP